MRSAARKYARQAGEHADVGERHHQRHAVHGVADRFALFEHRLVGLIVAAPIHGVVEAADVEVVLRQREMLRLVRGAIELHAVDRVALAAGERRIVSRRSRRTARRRSRSPDRAARACRSSGSGWPRLRSRCCRRAVRRAASAAATAASTCACSAGSGCVFSDSIAASSTLPVEPARRVRRASGLRTGS